MKIYIAHASNINFKEELYKPIKESSFFNNHTFIFPHDDSDEPFSSKEFFKNDANLVIAEVSEPSTGQGIELGWADFYQVSIVCFFRKGSNPSSSLKVVAEEIIEYENSEDLVEKIGVKLESFS